MQSQAATVEDYLAQQPDDRREALQALRQAILENLDSGFEEGMQYGMIGYFVPHRLYPAGYHCDPRQPVPFAALASQKNYMSLYLVCNYNDPEFLAWFQDAWRQTGKKLDMGKSCIRFKRLEDVPLEVLGEAIRRVPAERFLAHYEAVLRSISAAKRSGGAKAANRPAATARPTAKKTATKKTTIKKAVAKKAVAKKATAKKVATKKTTVKKVATKKTTVKKVATKKTTAKKAAARKKSARS